MKNKVTPLYPLGSARNIRYAITEGKKTELDALTWEVLDVQYEVQQYTAIVSSLSDKLSYFQNLLQIAYDNRAHTLNNRNLLDQLLQSTYDLLTNSGISFNEMIDADAKTKDVSKQMKNLIDKIIYSSEIINKLANFVTRKKALNPLISDELVSLLAKAGKDADNAVALTLVALQSAFAAEATNMESDAATSLGYNQAIRLYMLICGNNLEVAPNGKSYKKGTLAQLLYKAYDKAKKKYEEMHQACTIVTQQLATANAQLNAAQIKLQSLQSGLAAGNAAAMAS
jgi:hypothetical protein